MTGKTYMQALEDTRKAPQGYSHRSNPNPPRDQLGLEVVTFYQLVDEFQGHGTRPGTMLGLERVDVRDGHLLLVPAPEHSAQIVTRLLPSYHRESGNHYGVAGLRPRRRGTEWELRVLNTEARIRIPVEHFPIDVLSGEWNCAGEQLELMWQKYPHNICDEELNRWFICPDHIGRATRNMANHLFRDPRVVQQLNGRGTCWVDLYHHGYDDLMLEWCCGPTKDELAQWISNHSNVAKWLQHRPSASFDEIDVATGRGERCLFLVRHECNRQRFLWDGTPDSHLTQLLESFQEGA